jgi:hypothetical protein
MDGLTFWQQFSLSLARHSEGFEPRDDHEAALFRSFDEANERGAELIDALNAYFRLPREERERQHEDWLRREVAPDVFILEEWV